MSQINKPVKTVFIIAAGVPGDQAAEPMAVYYRGIVQKYEMTFKRSGTVRRCDPGQMERSNFPLKRKRFVGHSKVPIALQ